MALQKYAPKEEMKRDPSIMYKFGYTSQEDADLRQEVDFGKGKPPLARDFDVTTLWSGWFTPEQRIELENWFKETFPKNIWTQVFYNGITECRYFTYQQSKEITDHLYKTFPPYNRKQAEGLDHLYFQMLKKKAVAAAAK